MEDINVKARKAAYLSGHPEVGACMLYSAGFWMSPAYEVIEGKKKLVEREDSYKYNIVDDDWTPPDVDGYREYMMDVLSEFIEDVQKGKSDKIIEIIREYADMKYGHMALMIKKKVLKNPMANIDIFNEFVGYVGLDDKKIDIDAIRWL